MKSSVSSSATASLPPAASPSGTPPRRAFSLTGRSIALDPRIDPVRPDLADIRLADRVFAPHYAEPVMRRVAADAMLRAERAMDSERVGTLSAGDRFELLDLIGDDAWGVADGLVGWLPADSLSA